MTTLPSPSNTSQGQDGGCQRCVLTVCHWCVVGPQHLTTFVLDRKDGMMTVDDGVRRLRLLDAKGKVWTQEMLLQVDEKGVSLLDQETKVTRRTHTHTH